MKRVNETLPVEWLFEILKAVIGEFNTWAPLLILGVAD